MNIDLIIERAIIAFDVKNQEQLADILHILPSDLSARKRRGTLTKLIEKEADRHNKNYNWIKTGEGKMLKSQATPVFEPQSEYIKKYELLKKTEKILETDTVYRTALSSNIEAFHTAITCHEELAVTNKRVDKVEEENKKLKEEISEIKDRLPAIGE
jgi:hypothetical protein